MNFRLRAVATVICAFPVSGCANRADHSAYVSRPVPNSHVLLVPTLRGGWAGWSLATGYQTAMEDSSGGGQLTTTSTGPIFAGQGCEEDETSIQIYALTASEVVSVSVADGAPVPTTTNPTLPDRLHAAAVEVLRHDGHPSIGRDCPRLTPLDADGKPIKWAGRAGRPQAFRLSSTRRWRAPARPPRGGLSVFLCKWLCWSCVWCCS